MPHGHSHANGRVFRNSRAAVLALALSFLAVPASASPEEQVFATELAFAKSMADRSLSSFSEHIADEAIFFNGSEPLRGKPEIVKVWSRFFEGTAAPFSWAPDRVEVLKSGSLALSTGLVRNQNGQVIARFNSVWRQEQPGVWRIVFDKGSPPEASDKQ